MSGDLNSYQAQALRLVARGFVIMPAWRPKPGATKESSAQDQGKLPFGNGWQKSRPLTEAQAFATWTGDNPPNISILTGDPSGVFVLDIDPDAGGFDSMKGFIAVHGGLPATYVVQTGSGGYHYYFKMPATNLRNTQSKIAPGLDTRANGGQVIAAGSRSYKGPYIELTQEPVAEAPGWLLELLWPKDTTPKALADAPAATPEQASAYESSVVNAELARLDNLARPWVEGAGWDVTTFEVACVLTQMANSDWTSLTHEMVDELMEARGPQDEAWGIGEIRAKVASARHRVGDKTRQPPTGGSIDLLAGMPRRGAVDQASVDQATPWTKHSWDDFGLAERIVALHGEVLRWVPNLDKWVVFLDGRWVDFKSGGERAAMDTINRLHDLEAQLYSDRLEPKKTGTGQTSERLEFAKWVRDQRYAMRARSAATAVRYAGTLDASSHEFDDQPLLLNVANGVVDLISGALLDHSPDLLMRQQSPVAYDPAAECPMWMRFLERVMPSPDMRAYLQRIVGYSITGDVSEQVFFLHHGKTNNGKSLFFEVMRAMLGDYSQVTVASTLLAQKQEQHPTDIARMEGRRFLILDETPQGARLNEALAKRLAGGGRVVARGMGQDFREFEMIGKHHLATNHLPHINHDAATIRRLRMVEWPVEIPEEEIDRYLAAKIIATELPGVLAWAVRGVQEWHRFRLSAPVEAQMDVAKFVEEEDTLGTWLTERTIGNTWTSTDILYRSYKNWCEAGSIQALTLITFGKELKARNIEIKKGSGGTRGWLLGLRSPDMSTWIQN